MAKYWVIIGFAFWICSVSLGAVYDGGSYSTKKVYSSVDVGPLGPDLTPQFHDSLRFADFPLAKAFYVIGEDKKCYLSSLAKAPKLENRVVMIVYYSSPVTAEHCIYQSHFDPKPSGTSILVKNGGICVNSHADVEGEHYDWVAKVDEGEMPLINCFQGVESFGDNIDKKHHKSIAEEAPAAPVEAAPVVQEQVKTQPHIQSVEEPSVVKKVQEVRAEEPKVIEIKTEPVKAEEKPKPVVAKTEPSKPVTRAPSSKEPYTLQLSSHTSAHEAESVIAVLKEKGVEAFVLEGAVNGTTRYRVCTGHYGTTKSARQEKDQMAQNHSEFKNAFVQMIK